MFSVHARPAVNETAGKGPQKFPRSSRLLKHADFQAVYQQGKKHFSGNMIAFYCESGRSGGPRVGFTVGKVLGGAVERNRIRRRMREAVRRHLSELCKPLDLVLHPRKSVLKMNFAALEAEVVQLLAAVQRGRSK
jgi:ribonuclease P protein component